MKQGLLSAADQKNQLNGKRNIDFRLEDAVLTNE